MLVIRECKTCQSVDLKLVHCQKEKLRVKNNWSRLVMDITHYGSRHFLMLIPLSSWYGDHYTDKILPDGVNFLCVLMQQVKKTEPMY